jgi:hypothetical protein
VLFVQNTTEGHKQVNKKAKPFLPWPALCTSLAKSAQPLFAVHLFNTPAWHAPCHLPLCSGWRNGASAWIQQQP